MHVHICKINKGRSKSEKAVIDTNESFEMMLLQLSLSMEGSTCRQSGKFALHFLALMRLS